MSVPSPSPRKLKGAIIVRESDFALRELPFHVTTQSIDSMSHPHHRGNNNHNDANRASNNPKNITLESAMCQLRSMFPNLSDSLIRRTLFDTKGRMEQTIEVLLREQQSRDIDTPSIPCEESSFPDERSTRHSLPVWFLRSPPKHQSGESAQRTASKSITATRTRKPDGGEEEKRRRALQKHIDLERGLVLSGLVSESSSSEIYRKHKSAQEQNNRIGTMSPSKPMRHQQGTFSKLSEVAKKRFREFQIRFKRPNSGRAVNRGRELEYTALSQRDDDYESDGEGKRNRELRSL